MGCQRRPAHAARNEILAAVPHHVEKRFVRLGDATFKIKDADPNDVGLRRRTFASRSWRSPYRRVNSSEIAACAASRRSGALTLPRRHALNLVHAPMRSTRAIAKTRNAPQFQRLGEPAEEPREVSPNSSLKKGPCTPFDGVCLMSPTFLRT
jgi:hypothetical protein